MKLEGTIIEFKTDQFCGTISGYIDGPRAGTTIVVQLPPHTDVRCLLGKRITVQIDEE